MLPDSSIHKSYNRLVEEIEEQIARLDHRFRTILKCGPGCAECCISFSVLPLEAALISAALEGRTARPDREDTQCVLLENDLCSIYTARPIICRTQGLPIGYVDEEEGNINVSACPLNFEEDYAFSYDDLLLMDTFNNILAELNGKYCRAVGRDPGQRIDIAELVR